MREGWATPLPSSALINHHVQRGRRRAGVQLTRPSQLKAGAEGITSVKTLYLLYVKVKQSISQRLESFEAHSLLTNVDGQICKDDAS